MGLYINILIFFNLIFNCLENTATHTEELLYKTLLNPIHYEKNVRPTTHYSIPTNITFGVLLNQIVEMVILIIIFVFKFYKIVCQFCKNMRILFNKKLYSYIVYNIKMLSRLSNK